MQRTVVIIFQKKKFRAHQAAPFNSEGNGSRQRGGENFETKRQEFRKHRIPQTKEVCHGRSDKRNSPS